MGSPGLDGYLSLARAVVEQAVLDLEEYARTPPDAPEEVWETNIANAKSAIHFLYNSPIFFLWCQHNNASPRKTAWMILERIYKNARRERSRMDHR